MPRKKIVENAGTGAATRNDDSGFFGAALDFLGKAYGVANDVTGFLVNPTGPVQAAIGMANSARKREQPYGVLKSGWEVGKDNMVVPRQAAGLMRGGGNSSGYDEDKWRKAMEGVLDNIRFGVSRPAGMNQEQMLEGLYSLFGQSDVNRPDYYGLGRDGFLYEEGKSYGEPTNDPMDLPSDPAGGETRRYYNMLYDQYMNTDRDPANYVGAVRGANPSNNDEFTSKEFLNSIREMLANNVGFGHVVANDYNSEEGYRQYADTGEWPEVPTHFAMTTLGDDGILYQRPISGVEYGQLDIAGKTGLPLLPSLQERLANDPYIDPSSVVMQAYLNGIEVGAPWIQQDVLRFMPDYTTDGAIASVRYGSTPDQSANMTIYPNAMSDMGMMDPRNLDWVIAHELGHQVDSMDPSKIIDGRRTTYSEGDKEKFDAGDVAGEYEAAKRADAETSSNALLDSLETPAFNDVSSGQWINWYPESFFDGSKMSDWEYSEHLAAGVDLSKPQDYKQYADAQSEDFGERWALYIFDKQNGYAGTIDGKQYSFAEVMPNLADYFDRIYSRTNLPQTYRMGQSK